MRQINTIYVIQTGAYLHDIVQEAREIGFLYPAPHIYITKHSFDDDEEPFVVERPRPLCHPCALVRDSRISTGAIGVALHVPSGNIPISQLATAAAELSKIIEDIGISDYQILTNEHKKDAQIPQSSISTLYSAIANYPSYFNRLK